jgi:hypothetical protein
VFVDEEEVIFEEASLSDSLLVIGVSTAFTNDGILSRREEDEEDESGRDGEGEDRD